MLNDKTKLAQASFTQLGNTFQMSFNLACLSGRDKVALCHALMQDLGIAEAFAREPIATAAASEIISNQWNKAWEG